jgi:ornithine cyclodeaminase
MNKTDSSRRITFLYLSEPDVIAAGITDMPACIDTMEDVFRLLGEGDYRLPGVKNNSHGAWLMFPKESQFPRMPIDGPDRRFMAMPAYIGGDYHATGVKWYGSNAENKKKGLPRSILTFILNDTETGAPKAIMSANLLSAIRTGAVPGVGTRYFAKPDAKVLGIVGPGVMNRTSLAAFMAERPGIETIKIFGRGKASIDSYCALIAKDYPLVKSVLVVDSIEEAVRDADIVSVAASASGQAGSIHYPLLKREWIKPGAFLSLPANVRIDEELRADDVLKVVDNRGQYEAWAEDHPSPHHEHVGIIGNHFMDLIESGVLVHDDIVDFGKIVLGEAQGRTDSDQIVLFSIGGLPMEDVAWANRIYENALEMGIGTELLLWDVPALA